MSITNFEGLNNAVQSWANRTDPGFVGEIPGFISLAECRMYDGNETEGSDALRIKELEAELSVGFTNGLAALPSGLIEMRALTRDNDPTGLDYLAPQRFEVMKADLNSGGNPGYYTIKAGNLELAPAWTGTLVAHYYQKTTALTAAADTNVILTACANMYLWGALIEAFEWMDNTEKSLKMLARYNGAVKGINTMNGRAIRSGVAKRLHVPLNEVV